MTQQSTTTLVMVSPDHFGFNAQTADTNPYQHTPQSVHKNSEQIRNEAITEFQVMVDKLKSKGINVLVLQSPPEFTPDAIFPNNWFTHHQGGTLVYFPMLAANRRLERQKKELEALLKDASIPVSTILDLTADEKDNHFLEATGSMVFDRVKKIAFAMASPRTDESEFKKFCERVGYEPVYLKTPKGHRNEVYHTNLLMCIGSEFAVVCAEVLEDEDEEGFLKMKLEELGKEYIEISLKQVYSYCGNILEVQNKKGKKFVIMSDTAYKAFTKEQLAQLEQCVEILTFSIPVIEEIGGGGVRCMVAEVFK